MIMSESTYGFTLNEADSYAKTFNQLRRPIDLTTKVVAYATAQGNFGDVWKCTFSDKDINAEVGMSFIVNSDILMISFKVAVKCARIKIQDNSFKNTVTIVVLDH